MEERRSLFRWIKEHKKQLIAVGVSIVALLATIWGIKHRSQLKELWEELKALILAPEKRIPDNIPELTKEVTEPISVEAEVETCVAETSPEATVDAIPETISDVAPDPIEGLSEEIAIRMSLVHEHLRNLHEGRHPSAEKIEEALSKGIILRENQTLVDEYLKGVVA